MQCFARAVKYRRSPGRCFVVSFAHDHGSDLVIAELRPPTLCARLASRGSLAQVVTAVTNGVSAPAILVTFSDDLGNGSSSYAMLNA